MIEKYNQKEYKRSRKAYIVECALEYFIGMMVADAFLAKVLINMGFADSDIGIISSLTAFSFLFQIFTVILMNKIRSVKKTAIICDTLGHLLLMGVYLIPFLNVSVRAKTIFVITCILGAYLIKYPMSSAKFKWANSYVNPVKRGEYSGIKEIFSLFSGVVFSLSMGYMIDRYEAAGKLRIAFIAVAMVMLILNVLNLISLLMIKREEEFENASQKKLSDIIKNTLGNKNFRNVIILTVIWDIAKFMTIGFMGVYKTKDLAISVAMIQVIGMVAMIARMIVTIPFGRLSDKKSYAKCMEIAFIVAALSFFVNVFTVPERWWLIIAFTVIFEMSQAGIGQNVTNISYSYVKEEYIVYSMVIRNCIGGILGFGTSILASKILEYIQENNNMIFGIECYAQQVLSLISFVIMIIAVLFDRLVVEKQKVMIQ